MNTKFPILNKLRPGNRCKYIGENNKYGFIKGRNYYIIERLPKLVSFSNETNIGVDYGLSYDGEYFFENWEVLDQERLLNLPDFDYEKENEYLKYLKQEFRILNKTI